MKKRLTGVDLVAAILALTLALGVLMLLITAMVNVNSSPVLTTQAIGENTTQVLTAVLGGIVGVLGGYVGSRHRKKEDEEGRDEDQ
jgi:hypothetical protein